MGFSLKSLVSVATVLGFVFVAGAAGAAGIAPNANLPAKPYTQQKDCSKSVLTSEKFLELFYTIAMHGDLTDIPFIEKTLQVKLTHKYAMEGGKPNPHRIIYGAANILGAPLYAGLDVTVDHDQQIAREDIGIIRFGDLSKDSFFIKCLHISSLELSKYFGGHFHEVPNPDSFISIGAGKQLGKIGKNGSKISVGYSYNTDDNIVDGISIHQNP
jgi:hypothetical protein